MIDEIKKVSSTMDKLYSRMEFHRLIYSSYEDIIDGIKNGWFKTVKREYKSKDKKYEDAFKYFQDKGFKISKIKNYDKEEYSISWREE